MTEPIFAELEHEAGAAGRRAFADITGHFRHHGYDSANALPRVPEETPMSTITEEIRKDLTEGLDYIKGFAERVSAAAPDIIAVAEKTESSPVAQLLEKLALGPEFEKAVAGVIADLAKFFSVPSTASDAEAANDVVAGQTGQPAGADDSAQQAPAA